MKRNVDLLKGNILRALTELAVPIMASSLVQTAYNLTDMAWIGMVGSQAVAAVGAAGMYSWFATGVVALARMGGQVKAAQAYGEGDSESAVQYGRGALQIALALALAYGLMVNLFTRPLIGFFHLNQAATAAQAEIYLRIACGLILFSFMGQTLTGLYTASGNSKTPFLANLMGMAANMVLDPVLIMGIGPFPALGVAGAAIATVTAQAVVAIVLMALAVKDPLLRSQLMLWKSVRLKYIKNIVRIGFPSAVQNMIYTSISMVLTRFVTQWGDTAVAVQRVGGQIESISWTTAEGFGTAINAFTGQNYGAGSAERVKKGYLTSVVLMFIWGSAAGCLLFFGAAPIFGLFIHEAQVIEEGASYMRILGLCEMFMCIELMTVGAMSGLGKTLEASIISILLTAMRIPLAAFLGQTFLGLDGVWWALTISSILKGIVFFAVYMRIMKKYLSKSLARAM